MSPDQGVAFRAAEALRAAGIDDEVASSLCPRVDASDVVVRPAPAWFHRMWFPGIVAVAAPWGIYVAPNVYSLPKERLGRLVVHELMHMEQWRRLGGARHATRYLGDYLRGRVRGLSHWEAYRGIRLEAEARAAAGYAMWKRQ